MYLIWPILRVLDLTSGAWPSSKISEIGEWKLDAGFAPLLKFHAFFSNFWWCDSVAKRRLNGYGTKQMNHTYRRIKRAEVAVELNEALDCFHKNSRKLLFKLAPSRLHMVTYITSLFFNTLDVDTSCFLNSNQWAMEWKRYGWNGFNGKGLN